MPRIRQLAFVTSIALIVIGLTAAIGSASLGYFDEVGPGAGFLPFWFAAILTFLAVIMFVGELRAVATIDTVSEQEDLEPMAADSHRATLVSEAPLEQTADIAETAAGAGDPREHRRLLIGTLVSLACVVLLIDIVGFQLTVFGFLLVQVKYLGRRNWIVSLIVSAIGSFGLFYLFTSVLSVYLPPSSIEFLRLMGL